MIGRKWQPTPVFLPRESQGQGSLVGCRLWGLTESDMTEATWQQQQQQQDRGTAFLGGAAVKNLPASAGDMGLIPGLGRSPGEGHGYPPQYSCLENPHGQRNLVGYNPGGHKESVMTERLSIAQHKEQDRKSVV